MLTEDELNWVRSVLLDYDPLEISPSYIHKKKTELEWFKNKGKVRKELDKLRKMIKVTPQELIELKDKSVRGILGIKNFAGIYIIHNSVKDIYYVGQSESVFDRAYMHFVTNPEEIKGRYELTVKFNLPEIYIDYSSGDEFNISLIPLENTSFSSLNELEGYAIVAYNSLVPDGYNRVMGNILDKPIFKNEDYEKAAKLLFDRIKETKGEEFLLTLTTQRKRIFYTYNLLLELELPDNLNFRKGLSTMIKEYNKANKSKK